VTNSQRPESSIQMCRSPTALATKGTAHLRIQLARGGHNAPQAASKRAAAHVGAPESSALPLPPHAFEHITALHCGLTYLVAAPTYSSLRGHSRQPSGCSKALVGPMVFVAPTAVPTARLSSTASCRTQVVIQLVGWPHLVCSTHGSPRTQQQPHHLQVPPPSRTLRWRPAAVLLQHRIRVCYWLPIGHASVGPPLASYRHASE
jgi:hypothetical protein